MQEEVVKKLRNLYLEYGEDLFVDNARLNSFLDDILFDYPVEKKRLKIIIKENIVNNLIYERENALLSKSYMYINLMQDVYGMSEEMAYELINTVYFAIYGFYLQKNEKEEKKNDTVHDENIDIILRDFTDDDVLKSNRKGFIFEKCVVGYNGEDGYVYVSDATKYTFMAFRSNEAIKHVVWDYEYISPTCFLECKNLESVELSDRVKVIAEWAFRDCVLLKEIRIPSSVQVIHPTAFSHSGITNIIMDNEMYSYENGFLMESVSHWLIWVNKNIVGNNIIIPNGIEEILNEAFDSYDYNDRLQITIPDTVKKICSTECVLLGANIKCKKDSHAHKYAEAYGCKYEIV